LREFFDKLSDDDMNLLAESLSGDDLLKMARGSKIAGLAKILIKKPKLLMLAKHLI
jgi:hypothetical protein